MAVPTKKSIDPSSPEVAAFMKGVSVLILDQSSSSRTTLRRLMSALGTKPSAVETSDFYEAALERLKAVKPTVVFCDYSLGKYTAIDFYQEFIKVVPNRLQAIFVVIGADNSPATSASVGEAEADALMVRPFTYGGVQDQFLEILSAKLSPSNYMKMIEAGRRFAEAQKPEQAIKAFAQAQALESSNPQAFYYEGMARRLSGDADGARRCFEAALKVDPKHYRTFVALFELHMENRSFDLAYEIGVVMTANYPLNPRRIPDLVRLCIMKEKYDEIVQFYDAVSKIESADESLIRYVSAGLVVAGKNLIKRGSRTEAAKIFKKAEILSKGKAALMKEIIIALYGAGAITEAEDFVKRVPPEISQSDDVQLSILDTQHLQGPDGKVFLASQALIAKGIQSVRLYEIAILQGKGIKRPEPVIQEIVWKAAKLFPDKKEFFEKLLSG